MHKFKTKVNTIMKICNNVLSTYFDKNDNIPRRGHKPRCSNCFIIAISILAKFEEIDGENRPISILQEHKRDFPYLISRRQYNDYRKALLPYCTKLQHHLAKQIDGGEHYFCIASKPVAVWRSFRSSPCRFSRGEGVLSSNWRYCASQQTFYFGYKLHAVCGLNGVIHSCDISKASVYNIN